jgi:Flp pilus assembly protein TadD
MLWPARLAYFYPHPATGAHVAPTFWIVSGACVVLLAGLTWLVLRERRERPWLAIGWLWFAGMLVPMIGVVQVGAQAWADRYAYLPLVGLHIAVAWSVAEIVERRPRSIAIVAPAVAIALAGLAVATWRQAGTWKDSRTLFTHALAVTSHNPVAETHLGTLLNVAGDLDGAEARYREALRLAPEHADALSALGIVYAKRGDLVQAAEQFERAIAAAPEHADAQHNLGLVLRARGDLAGAEGRFREAVRLRPDFAKAWLALGQVREARGDRSGAAEAYARSRE